MYLYYKRGTKCAYKRKGNPATVLFSRVLALSAKPRVKSHLGAYTYSFSSSLICSSSRCKNILQLSHHNLVLYVKTLVYHDLLSMYLHPFDRVTWCLSGRCSTSQSNRQSVQSTMYIYLDL